MAEMTREAQELIDAALACAPGVGDVGVEQTLRDKAWAYRESLKPKPRWTVHDNAMEVERWVAYDNSGAGMHAWCRTKEMAERICALLNAEEAR